VLDTLPRAGGRLQSVMGAGAEAAPQPPDPAQAADAIARFLALREFRARLYSCLTSRPDALLELCDAVLCADHAVTSLVQLSLEAEFTRGHGALYDALAAGGIDEEAFAALLAQELPPLADGEQGRAWIAEHDTIGYGLLEAALAGLPDEQAAQVREACARWSRLRSAVDAAPYPRPDAECSPEREHVHHDACCCDGVRKTIPGWEYQFLAAAGHLRTAWTALIDAGRTTKAAKVRTPEQADRWVRLVMAAYAQLLIARTGTADLRRPWEKPPDPDRPLTPGRVRRGFPNIRRHIGTPAHVAKPGRPGPGRPKGTTRGPAPRYPIPKKSRIQDKQDGTAETVTG